MDEAAEESKKPAELPGFARDWLAQRRWGHAQMEAMRLRELRAMTELESARIFAQLDVPPPYPLRPSSGLVEQQRWFMQLYQRERMP